MLTSLFLALAKNLSGEKTKVSRMLEALAVFNFHR